ncbi:MAG: hypothetical protein IT461_15420 [Planctomycetes bacterium]|jgi:hypothetical protein|nr:hypothetical protein [Planctomycetota bacterium]
MEDLLIALEPYASFRFTLGLVLTGLTIYVMVNSAISLRQFYALMHDFDQQAKGQRLLDQARLALDPSIDLSKSPRLQARPGRIIRNYVALAWLRLFSWRTLWRHWREFALIVLLSAACVPAYWYVFA